MNSKKIIAMSTALIMAAGMTACAGSSETSAPTETTTEATTTAPKELNEEDAAIVQEIDTGDTEKLENGTVKWLSFWDLNPANGKPKSVELELFETKYGGKIEYIPTTYDTRYSDLSTQVLGGTSPDIFPAADLDTFPGKTINGMFEAWDDCIDFNADFWPEGAKKVSDMHMLGGKHYVAAVGTDAGCVMIYNKKVMEENGFDDPSVLLANDNWTWDTFKDMCLAFSDAENEKYGFDGWWFEINFLLTTGTPVINVENGKIKSNITSVEMERAENFMLDLKKNDIPFPHDKYDWQVFPNRVGEGTTLFYPCGIWALYEADLSAYGNSEDIMFVPMPKDPSADAYYLPTGIDAYALCKGAPNPEGAAAFIKCKCLAYGDETALEIAEKQYVEDYGWNEDMINMLRITKDLTAQNPVLDFYAGTSTDIYQMVHDPIKATSYQGKDWATTKDEISGAVQTELDNLNAQIAEQFGE